MTSNKPTGAKSQLRSKCKAPLQPNEQVIQVQENLSFQFMEIQSQPFPIFLCLNNRYLKLNQLQPYKCLDSSQTPLATTSALRENLRRPRVYNPRRGTRTKGCSPHGTHPWHWTASKQTSERGKCEFQLLLHRLLPIWLQSTVQSTERVPTLPPRKHQPFVKPKANGNHYFQLSRQKISAYLFQLSFTFSGSFFYSDFSLLMLPTKFGIQLQNLSLNSIVNAIRRIRRFSHDFLLFCLEMGCAAFLLLIITETPVI